MSSIVSSITPQTERIKKCARIYFAMMTTDGVAPKLTHAMIKAGYSPRSVVGGQKKIAQNKAFLEELRSLELLHFDYTKNIEIARNKAVKTLVSTDYDAIRSKKDVAQIANTTNEMLRLERGQSTQNLSMAQFLQELNKDNVDDPTLDAQN